MNNSDPEEGDWGLNHCTGQFSSVKQSKLKVNVFGILCPFGFTCVCFYTLLCVHFYAILVYMCVCFSQIVYSFRVDHSSADKCPM